MSDESIWKKRFENLHMEIKNINEKIDMGKLFEIGDIPVSESEDLWISNDWDVCDSKEFAKDNWEKGKYRRYTLAKGE